MVIVKFVDFCQKRHRVDDVEPGGGDGGEMLGHRLVIGLREHKHQGVLGAADEGDGIHAIVLSSGDNPVQRPLNPGFLLCRPMGTVFDLLER